MAEHTIGTYEQKKLKSGDLIQRLGRADLFSMNPVGGAAIKSLRILRMLRYILFAAPASRLASRK
jgi:hypothetical protein